MSKQSIRKKIEKAKNDADKIFAKKKLPEEAVLLIQSLLMILDIVVAVLLEKKVRKNSSNSGLPPSQGFASNGNRNQQAQNRKKGIGNRLPNSRTTQKKKTISPKECSNCHTDLSDVGPSKTEQRKKIDIVYEVQETTFSSETKVCPGCGEKNKADFPKGIDGKIQYGNGIKAAIINFLMVQMMSLQRVQEHFKGLIGRAISQATLLKYIVECSSSLSDWEDRMKKMLLKAVVIYVDETSMRVDKKTNWVHSYSAGDTVLQFVHPSRGTEAIEDIGILPKYGGIIVHDCWGSYFAYEGVENVLHALCNGHILRELKFVEESTKHQWATNLKKLLTKAIKEVHASSGGVLSKEKYSQLEENYHGILFEALIELPPFPESNGERGRPRHTEEQNLWHRLMDHESSVLMFARVKEVDPTNNRAERDLRINKLKKKVSGCFRTPEFAKHFCRILSYVKTMRNKGFSSLEAIAKVLSGNIPA